MATITHGDVKLFNLMFLHDDEGKPQKVKFLDHATGFLSHPAKDIFYFLYTATDKMFRKKYEDILWRRYFTIYNGYLSKWITVTFDEFMRGLAKWRLIGIFSLTFVRHLKSFKCFRVRIRVDFRSV